MTQFVGSTLEGYKDTNPEGQKAIHRHEVFAYSDDLNLVDQIARFVPPIAALSTRERHYKRDYEIASGSPGQG